MYSSGEILVQLTYLSIDLCSLLGDTKANFTIIGLHQKCLKLKALESVSNDGCSKCIENNQLLQPSNFLLLICLVAEYIDVVNICDILWYLWYKGNNNIWCPKNCNLQELYIKSDQLFPPDSFMKEISAHGELVHVIVSINHVTPNGIASLIKNSPRLITYYVYSKSDGLILKDFT